jgi:hypothetical protein
MPIDQLTGGLPLGALTEICSSNAPTSGITSVCHGILANTTRTGRMCALVDASDTFCPASASAAGVVLENLLWVRCEAGRIEKNRSSGKLKPLEQAFRVTDILLNTGGFSLIVIDIADIDETLVRKVPMSSWFRFQRFVEGKPVALAFVVKRPHAGSYAGMVLHVEAGEPIWSELQPSGPAHARLLRELPIRISIEEKRVAVHPSRKPPRGVGQIAAHMHWA